MFDFHLHSKVSFDSTEEPANIVAMAEKQGLKEICFTDHMDHHYLKDGKHDIFTIEEYNNTYDNLSSDKLKIRHGVEFGLTPWNQTEMDNFLSKRNFDFVLGSIHYADGYDPYYEEYWEHNSYEVAIEKYYQEVLFQVQSHKNFDVLGHLTYICKCSANPFKTPIPYKEKAEITDEIFKTLIANGKGIEVNTSGVDKTGAFLPSLDYIKRFRELGGEIITIGSDAHTASRVGQYTFDAIAMIKEVFPYVCTFENRQPIFQKI